MNETELYEATRKHWGVDRHRVSNIKIACSVYRGIIREVFIVRQWLPSPDSRRSYFEGEVAPQDIREKYLHRSVKEYWEKKGSQNPIRYME